MEARVENSNENAAVMDLQDVQVDVHTSGSYQGEPPTGKRDDDDDEGNDERSSVADSTKGNQEEECRFCFEVGTQDDPLVAPCKCRGTIGKVHKSCLRHWILEKRCTDCEICGETFDLGDETILTPEEILAYRQAFEVQQRIHVARFDESEGESRFAGRSLRAFLVRHERLSRWINACILFTFSVIMLLVIVFLVYNWNTYYKNRENVVLVNEVQPFESGIEVFTGFCDARSRMMCIVPRDTLKNSTSLQKRLCNDPFDEGKACLRYSTYSIHKSCSTENATCSLMLLPGVQDGFCDSMGTCDRVRNLPQEEKYQFEAHLISGVCLCR